MEKTAAERRHWVLVYNIRLRLEWKFEISVTVLQKLDSSGTGCGSRTQGEIDKI